MIIYDNLIGKLLVVVIEFDILLELIVKDIGEALVEDQGQNKISILRRISRATNHAGRVPQPGLQVSDTEMFIRVQGQR